MTDDVTECLADKTANRFLSRRTLLALQKGLGENFDLLSIAQAPADIAYNCYGERYCDWASKKIWWVPGIGHRSRIEIFAGLTLAGYQFGVHSPEPSRIYDELGMFSRAHLIEIQALLASVGAESEELDRQIDSRRTRRTGGDAATHEKAVIRKRIESLRAKITTLEAELAD